MAAAAEGCEWEVTSLPWDESEMTRQGVAGDLRR